MNHSQTGLRLGEAALTLFNPAATSSFQRSAFILLAALLTPLLSSAAVSPAATVPSYTLTDLGTLPGDNQSEGFAINDYEEAVGSSYKLIDFTAGPSHAVLYKAGKLLDLNRLLYPAGSPGGSGASAINACGEVVGAAFPQGYGEDGPTMGFLYAQGRIHTFAVPGNHYTGPTGINNFGQVVGAHARTLGDYASPFLRQPNGQIGDLGTFGDLGAVADGINNLGQIAGSTIGTLNVAFLLQPGSSTPKYLGSLGGDPTQVNALNDLGQVVGVGRVDYASSTYHAFLYTGGKIRDLGTPPTSPMSSWVSARGINNRGQIVGEASYRNSDNHGWVYLDGKMQDLNALIPSAVAKRYTITTAAGINTCGKIIANATLSNGETRAVILTPIH